MTKGTVSGVVSNMVTIRVDGPVMQGEICYIETGGDRLMAEVIKVTGQDAFVQVFESTRGLSRWMPTASGSSCPSPSQVTACRKATGWVRWRRITSCSRLWCPSR